MDAITAWALSIHNPLIRATGLFLDQEFLFTMVIIGLVILGEWKNDNRLKIFLTLVVAYFLGLIINIWSLNRDPV